MNIKNWFSRVIPHICGITTISYTPFATIDPTSPIKMAIIGTTAMVFICILLFICPKEFKSNIKSLIIILVYILNLVLVFLVSTENKIEQFYGTISRNFGLLSQVSLAVFCIVTIIFYSSSLIIGIKKALLVYGTLNITYGFLQVMGEDFVKNWDTTYVNSARGFFANPNQNSSFTALVALISLSNLLNRSRKRTEHIGTIIFSIFALINIVFSRSTQGFLILGFGIMILFLLFISQNKSFKKYMIPSFVIFIGLAVYTLLDIFQKVPWKPILYSSTVETRGDYWRAGIEMGKDNPWVGIGLDKYLEWYRIYRDGVAASRPYSSEVSNSAHNIFIDYFAFGGFPLLFIYILIQILVILKLVKIFKSISGYNSESITLLLLYTAFTLQSLVSPVHLGYYVWGWVTIGLILGWKLNQSSQGERKKIIPKNLMESSLDYSISNFNLISVVLIGILIGSLVSGSYFLQEVRFRKGVYGERTYQEIFNAAYIQPKSATRMAQASWKLYINGSKELSLKVALDSIKYSPNNYYGWLVLYSMEDLDPKLEEVVSLNIKRLEPRPRNIKKIM